MFRHLVGCRELVVFEKRDLWEEAKGIMYPSRALPHLTASHQSRNEGHVLRGEAPDFRTRAAKPLAGPVGRKETSEKLTEAHSGSAGLKIVGGGRAFIYYPPRAFEELEDTA